MPENDTRTIEQREETTEAAERHDVLDERHIATIEWLEDEFPEWEFEVDATETGGGEVTRWVARREGHHQQAELSAGKLQRRLSEYLDRQRARDLNPEDN